MTTFSIKYLREHGAPRPLFEQLVFADNNKGLFTRKDVVSLLWHSLSLDSSHNFASRLFLHLRELAEGDLSQTELNLVRSLPGHLT